MKQPRLFAPLVCLLAVLLLAACQPVAHHPPASEAAPAVAAHDTPSPATASGSPPLPVRYQTPSYSVAPLASGGMIAIDADVPVGADLTSAAPISLRDILKQLVVLKGMNISWANDIDQSALVDVDIRAEDGFFSSISNLLRQLDYYHEVEGNTIVVKYKKTSKFQIAMPFTSTKYSISLGGDVLGGSGQTGNMKGSMEMSSSENEFDIWANIEKNLKKVLEIWEQPAPSTSPASSAAPGSPEEAAAAAAQATAVAAAASRPPQGKGYYTIDRPIGLITVTAPRSILSKISDYIENLKSELYRQVVIEAKIVEVTLNSDNTTGINWENLLQNTDGFNFTLDFQKLNPLYSAGGAGRFLSMNNKSFDLFLDAIKTQGTVNVLANPKISVMNGQPAMLSVGQSVSYVDSVSTTTNDSGAISFTVSTERVMSGLGLSLIPVILDNNEVILNLTPVTSDLQGVNEETFGSGGSASKVGLPTINLREMNTVVRVKDGEMLVVGGLIDSTETESDSKIPGLGDIPGIGKVFGQGGKVVKRTELIIFLKPRITS